MPLLRECFVGSLKLQMLWSQEPLAELNPELVALALFEEKLNSAVTLVEGSSDEEKKVGEDVPLRDRILVARRRSAKQRLIGAVRDFVAENEEADRSCIDLVAEDAERGSHASVPLADEALTR